MSRALAWIDGELALVEAQGLRRHPVTVSSPVGPEVEISGRRVVQFCSNDYLGLAGDPRLRRAAAQAALRWGAGTGASRLVSGSTELHASLERGLARFKGCEDAVLFSSGYLANTGTIPALVGRGDAVFSDELNHASIIDGCRLSGATVVVYRHADVVDLDRKLGDVAARRRLVVTDSVFSMQGDLAPVGDIAGVCERHGAMLMVDDAHATGVLDSGSGAADIVMSTLSKALGSAGGFVAGSRSLVEWLRNRARSYMFDTAPGAASVAAAGAALEIVEAAPERALRVRASARRLAEGLGAQGFEVLPPAAAIVPVVVGEAAAAVELSGRLLKAGVLVPAIRPPSVPVGTARLRWTLSAAHTEEHVERALEACGSKRRRRPASIGGRLDPRIVRAGGVFVTGTGTGVGKTVVAAALARTLGAGGRRVGAMKPAQTGTSEGADDLAFIRLAGGVPLDRCAAPYAFAAPLAPSVCASLEGRSIEVGTVVDSWRALRGVCDLVVVEGAGGLLVPFSDSATMADLAAALGLPVLVVALAALGTINHTALTVEAALSRGLDVIGVVLSRFPARPGLAEATNPVGIERMAGVEVVGVVPELDGIDVDRAVLRRPLDGRAWLGPGLGGTFDRAAFLDAMTGEVAAVGAEELV